MFDIYLSVLAEGESRVFQSVLRILELIPPQQPERTYVCVVICALCICYVRALCVVHVCVHVCMLMRVRVRVPCVCVCVSLGLEIICYICLCYSFCKILAEDGFITLRTLSAVILNIFDTLSEISQKSL
eukprot:c9652_g1_i3.p1 GENE.c9652_g1_i3~~c9652_g1_i3.p1  ORF type:complete len:129 (-),score=14.55 c9652_g1_i3:50-436(-)